MQSQKAVFKLGLNDDKEKKKAMEIASASGFAGAESITMDMKDTKLTVVGDMDPVVGDMDSVESVEKLRKQLRKHFSPDIVGLGPVKEAQKKDDNKKDNPDKKDDNKSNENEQSEDSEPDPPIVWPEPDPPIVWPAYYQPPRTYYQPPPVYYHPSPFSHYYRPPPVYNYGRYSAEEDPTSCVIC